MKEIEMVLGYLLINYRVRLDKDVDDIFKYQTSSFGSLRCEPSIGVRICKL